MQQRDCVSGQHTVVAFLVSRNESVEQMTNLFSSLLIQLCLILLNPPEVTFVGRIGHRNVSLQKSNHYKIDCYFLWVVNYFGKMVTFLKWDRINVADKWDTVVDWIGWVNDSMSYSYLFSFWMNRLSELIIDSLIKKVTCRHLLA